MAEEKKTAKKTAPKKATAQKRAAKTAAAKAARPLRERRRAATPSRRKAYPARPPEPAKGSDAPHRTPRPFPRALLCSTAFPEEYRRCRPKDTGKTSCLPMQNRSHG